MHLLLASKSPRRRELISRLGWPVRVVDIDVDERIDGACEASKVAERIAIAKSGGYPAGNLNDGEILVTADTVVVVDDKVLGKPHSEEAAMQMLRQLSGRWHTVYSGVCLRTRQCTDSFTEATGVHFRQLSDREISHYVRTCHPMDKAGAYGIQEWIGMIGIDRIEGCYYNVMGLPLAQLYSHILRMDGEL